ncbi:type II toxin-antitoxin system VapC family toxin [Craurococcus roseus]|uniref:Ribonuclease VapC n=1 Tax=Craurococcus roseus TaxID=77585 RepID=A0ABP3Q1U4_9PROT
MTVFVLDAPTAIAWILEDERHPTATEALASLRAKDQARVPTLWWFEVRNALVANERRGRLGEADTAAFLRDLGRLAIDVDRSPDETALLTLARRHRLTAYDAAYLELARREGLPLASLNGDLRKAAPADGVPLLGA